MGQFYWQLQKESGLTMRQLGEIHRKDPELYAFMEEALSEQNRRVNDEVERAKNQ